MSAKQEVADCEDLSGLGNVLTALDPEGRFDAAGSHLGANTFSEFWTGLSRKPSTMIWLAMRTVRQDQLGQVNVALRALGEFVESASPKVMPWQASLLRINTFKPFKSSDADAFFFADGSIVRVAHKNAPDVITVPRILRRELSWRTMRTAIAEFERAH